MGIYDRQWYREDERVRRPPSPNPVVRNLIVANIVMFVFQAVARGYLGWSVETDGLGLRPDQVVEKLMVWELVTSMFLHAGVMHLFLNMFVLYMFGRHVERVLGSRRFFRFYMLAGIVAGVAYVVFGYLRVPFLPAVGASGAIMGVVVYFTMLSPNTTVYLFLLVPMRMIWATSLIVGVDLYFFLFPSAGGGGIAHPAHLGGALFGFLYYRFAGRVDRFFHRLETRSSSSSSGRREKKRRAGVQAEVDRLLEKIHQGGIESLSRRERDFLRDASKRLRDEGS